MSEKEIEFMNLQLEKAAQPPAVDRERRLREALETLNHAAKVAISTQYGGSFDEDTPLVIRLLDGTCDATDELLADQPPPDPREAALDAAEKALLACQKAQHQPVAAHARYADIRLNDELAKAETESALAAIRAARGKA